MSTEGERIELIISKFCKSKAEFARVMEESPQTISNWVARGAGRNVLDKIIGKFPEINANWLLTNEGEMLKGSTSSEPARSIIQSFGAEGIDELIYIPLLPISAQGGTLNDFVVSVKGSDCEQIVSPIRGAEFGIIVTGDSMAPEYTNGSKVLIKKINERAFIDWGKTYVLDTCNGVVIKVLVPAEREGYVRCLSINTDPIYAPFEVSYEDIYGIYRVLMCMSSK